jgi:hypothetical protein
MVDDDSHGAVVAMGAHINDGARERAFPERRHRDQELSFQTGRRRRIRLSHDRLVGIARELRPLMLFEIRGMV